MDMLLSGSGQGLVEQGKGWDFRASKGRHGNLDVQRRCWAGKAAGRQRGHIRAQRKGGCYHGVGEGKESMAPGDGKLGLRVRASVGPWGGAGVGREGSGVTAGCTQAAALIPRSSGRKATGSSR